MLWKIISGILAIAALLGVAFKFDVRWVKADLYAGDKSVVQKRLDVIEQRSIQASIDDLEDRLDSPKLSSERKGKLKERVRRYKLDLKDIGIDNSTGGRK